MSPLKTPGNPAPCPRQPRRLNSDKQLTLLVLSGALCVCLFPPAIQPPASP